jgi:uncharacterized protein YjbJ (UPF0337 family)
MLATTGDRALAEKGTADQLAGDVKQAGENVKNAFKQ